jgi:hypothetical protein
MARTVVGVSVPPAMLEWLDRRAQQGRHTRAAAALIIMEDAMAADQASPVSRPNQPGGIAIGVPMRPGYSTHRQAGTGKTAHVR